MSIQQFLPVYISSGHSVKAGRDRGAASKDGTFIEGVQAAKYRKDLVAKLLAKGLVAVIDHDDTILSDSIAFFKNKTTANALVIDLHFNAGPEKATGTETLIPAQPTMKEVEFAYDFSYATHKIMSIPLRGKYKSYSGVRTELESHHGRLGWMRLTGENILHEFCFLSNPEELEKFEINREALLEAHANVIIKHAKIEPKKVSDNIKYVVKLGDTLSSISKKHDVTIEHIMRKNGLTKTTIYVGQKLIM